MRRRTAAAAASRSLISLELSSKEYGFAWEKVRPPVNGRRRDGNFQKHIVDQPRGAHSNTKRTRRDQLVALLFTGNVPSYREGDG